MKDSFPLLYLKGTATSGRPHGLCKLTDSYIAKVKTEALNQAGWLHPLTGACDSL